MSDVSYFSLFTFMILVIMPLGVFIIVAAFEALLNAWRAEVERMCEDQCRVPEDAGIDQGVDPAWELPSQWYIDKYLDANDLYMGEPSPDQLPDGETNA